MGEDTALGNGRISDFQGLVTLTLDRVILHTVMHLPAYQISLKSKKAFVDGRTYGRTFDTHFIMSTQRSQPKKPSTLLFNGYANVQQELIHHNHHKLYLMDVFHDNQD